MRTLKDIAAAVIIGLIFGSPFILELLWRYLTK